MLGADLAGDQQEVAERYERLKGAALRIAESADDSAQARAEQIRLAIRKSQELRIEDRLSAVVRMLEDQRLAAAASDQDEIARQLEELLRLMLEDPREARLAAERKLLEKLARDLRSLIERQRSLRYAIQRSRIERLADPQSELADETSEARAASLGIEPNSPEAPTLAQQLGKAEDAMRKAAQAIGEADKDSAEEQQLEAQRAMEAALREVEESLRQLREEEQQRLLAGLADRLKEMHRGESELLADTSAVYLKGNAASRSTRVKIANLSQRQLQLAEEARRAARLVEADSMSLVFADALGQTEHDMRAIVRRLRREEIGESTQALQQAVIDALVEMIDAVDSTLDDLDRQRQSRQQQGGEAGIDSSLVARLAELRMLRAVQARIRRQTETWHEIVRREGVMTEEARMEIAELAEQQRKLSEASRHAASHE